MRLVGTGRRRPVGRPRRRNPPVGDRGVPCRLAEGAEIVHQCRQFRIQAGTGRCRAHPGCVDVPIEEEPLVLLIGGRLGIARSVGIAW